MLIVTYALNNMCHNLFSNYTELCDGMPLVDYYASGFYYDWIMGLHIYSQLTSIYPFTGRGFPIVGGGGGGRTTKKATQRVALFHIPFIVLLPHYSSKVIFVFFCVFCCCCFYVAVGVGLFTDMYSF